NMRLNLKHLSEEEQKRNWSSEGFNIFGDILRDNSQDIDILCKNVISQLVKYLDVIQGGIFITQVDEYGNAFLELRGAYAYGREKMMNKKVTTYDGLVGRVYQEKEIVLINELPEDYTQISSGIGGTEPRSLLLLPLLTDDSQVKGIIELASLDLFAEYKVDFVQKLSNSITATITVIQSTRENQRILEESSRMYSENYLQEIRMNEGVRQKNLTKDELYGMIKQSQYRNQKQGTLLDSLADGVILVNQKLNVEVFNRGAEQIFQYRKNEIIGRPIHLILPNEFGSQEFNTIINFEDGAYGVAAIRRNTIAHKKEGDQFPVYLSLTEMRFNEDRYFVILAREI
ncbi:MAG: GAF domain-containing protein, partial [Bacteroidota bacterium]